MNHIFKVNTRINLKENNGIFDTAKKLTTLAKKTAKVQIVLPGSVFSIFINAFILIPVLYFLWSSFYQFSGKTGTISRSSLLTYVILARLIATIDPSIGIGYSLKSGDIVFKLIRPVDYIMLCISTAIGNIAAQTLIGVIPALVLSIMILKPPALIGSQLAFFIVSFVFALLLIVLLSLTVELLTFWTVNDWGLMMIYSGLYNILSGAVIPMEVFPKEISSVINFLPFASTIDSPLKLISQQVTLENSLRMVGLQLLWIVIIYLLIRLLWRNAIQRIIVYGG